MVWWVWQLIHLGETKKFRLQIFKNPTADQVQATLSLYNEKDYKGALEKALGLLAEANLFFCTIFVASNAALGNYEAAIKTIML